MGNTSSKKVEKTNGNQYVELNKFHKDLPDIIKNGENGVNDKKGNYGLVVNALKDTNTNIESETNDGYTALKLAVLNNYTDVAEVLINAGANPNIRIDTEPLLLFALNKLNIDIVKLLIESKHVDIDIQDKEDNTALLIAVKQKNRDIVEKLLAKGADANIRNNKHEMPIIMALNSIDSRNSPKIIMDLINSGADVNYVSRDEGKTPLHLASEIRYLADVVNELITKGANVNALTVNGETPLYIASRSNNIDIVKTLLNNNADVNIATKNGSTPIKVAYNNRYYELANFLLENGATADKETMETIRTQFDYANKKKEEAEAQASKDHRRRMGEGGGRKPRKPRKTRKKYNKRINVIKSKNKYSKKYHN
jgi:ankyrin repeat protein